MLFKYVLVVLNFYISFVYFNNISPPLEYKVIKNTTLVDLNYKLNNHLHHRRRVVNVNVNMIMSCYVMCM